MRIPVMFLVFVAASVDGRAEDWYAKSVKAVTLKVEPAEAKPGQTVTLSLIVQLHDGFHTYPIKQSDLAAASFVNKLVFPELDGLIFVGQTQDPEKPDVKPEPELGIQELRTYHGTVVYRRTAVVSPKATPGTLDVKLKLFKLSVCDKENCFPPKTLNPSTQLKVLEGPAVEIPQAYREEVQKVLGKQ